MSPAIVIGALVVCVLVFAVAMATLFLAKPPHSSWRFSAATASATISVIVGFSVARTWGGTTQVAIIAAASAAIVVRMDIVELL